MARRQFRDIARVAGLLFQGFPGQRKPARHLQASSGLFYEVFATYDPGNLLLHQAHREVLERQLESSRLGRTLARLSESRDHDPGAPAPQPARLPAAGGPDARQAQLRELADRVRRMQARLEKAAAVRELEKWLIIGYSMGAVEVQRIEQQENHDPESY